MTAAVMLVGGIGATWAGVAAVALGNEDRTIISGGVVATIGLALLCAGFLVWQLAP